MQTYEEFINGILESRGRFACGEEYHERHHINPRCMIGTDDEENLIDLFAREHFEAHRLLALENPKNYGLIYAWNMMCNSDHSNYQISAEEYEEARVEFSRAMSGEGNPMYGKYGEDNPNYGKHRTEEQKKKQSESMKGKMAGKNNPMYGKIPSDETRRKISDNAKERYKDKKNHPNYGNHKLVGKNHPKARKVIRLSDLKIYDCGKFAAEANNISSATMCYRCEKHKDFMYYDEWLLEQSN